MASYSMANRSYHACVLVSGLCFSFFPGPVARGQHNDRTSKTANISSCRVCSIPPKSESSPQKVNGELAAHGGGGCRGGKERRDEEEGNEDELWGPVSRAGDIMGEND